MTSLSQHNESVINQAFKRLTICEMNVIREGMIRLAKAGLAYLVEMHNMHELFMSHTTEKDTMAWAVGYNGLVIASGFYDGGDDDMPGTADATAASIIEGTTGWVAVILSEMEGYYRVDYEEDFLTDTSFNTASEFQTYFKKVS